MNMRTMAFAVALTLAQGAVCANVTRTITPGSGGCEVKLEWSFSGKVESDLVIEERLPSGWSMVDESVSIKLLDAWCCTNSFVRFAVNPTNVLNGSISFRVSGSSSGTIVGTWQLYLNGKLQKGTVGGGANLPASSAVALIPSSGEVSGHEVKAQAVEVAIPVAIKAFKVEAGPQFVLSYAGLPSAGTLVVEGCAGLGQDWLEAKRKEGVVAGDGSVTLNAEEAKGFRFYRMKFLTTEEKK